MNPLLNFNNTPYNTPRFEEIKEDDYIPAFENALEKAKTEILNISEFQEEPSFSNVIEALDGAGNELSQIISVFFNLNTACTNEKMQAIAQKISPILSEYSSSITLNEKLFQKVEYIYNNAPSNLTEEQTTLLKDTWNSFIKGGAGLKGEQRNRFKEIKTRLSILSLKFEENLLKETNAFTLNITNASDLAGLPDSTIQASAQAAKEAKQQGWTITLHAPSMLPFMKYSDKRDLRKKVYTAYASRCNTSNATIISEIVSLRSELAKLLGYPTYAEYVLSDRMANNSKTVNKFLKELLDASHPKALQEKRELEEFAHSKGLKGEIQKWDVAYYSNKLKIEKYSINDEMLKPYFELKKVQKGIFDLANELYGISFKEIHNIQKYNKDIQTFEVLDEKGEFLAILYTDFFPRSNKSGGAWMTEFREQHYEKGKDIRPLVSLVMNFTKPTEDKPALLTFNEVTTFLHEFGHSLHGMLSKTHYHSTSGTNVYRDFVELPSQLMENWAFEKEWLDKWASHYKTNQKIPQEYIAKIKKAANFQSGLQCDRQISFGMLDMAWHSLKEAFKGDIVELEKTAMRPTEIYPEVPGCIFSTGFGHIFSGGYAAGYYGYKWAEVLDADAFSVFKEKGITNKETASSFRKNILEKGGSEHPRTLYLKFRGKEPKIDALLKRSGLIK